MSNPPTYGISFDPLFHQLVHEGHIIHACITNGFNELLKARVGALGHFYAAFFNLAIAVERLGKLVFVLDHFATHLSPPAGDEVRKFSHDLEKLHKSAAEIAVRRGYSFAADFGGSAMEQRLLGFLAKIANGARYASLDAITGKSWVPPLADWSDILAQIIQTDMPRSERDQVLGEAVVTWNEIYSRLIVVAHDLKGNFMDASQYVFQSLMHPRATPYAVWRFARLIVPLTECVSKLASDVRKVPGSGLQIPHMDEFFEFLVPDKAYVVEKKQWP
jgi:hypothetical protein